MLQSWKEHGKQVDTDRARDLYHQIVTDAPHPEELNRDEQEMLLQYIRKVEKKDTGGCR